jgi:D-inositol-3-phosphate glycosyltransferase
MERPMGDDRAEPSQDPKRVAVFSLHTSPSDQPGSGDSGGMNVYISSVAERLAEQGIQVDIYTRRSEAAGQEIEELAPGARVIEVEAGPAGEVAKEALPGVLPEFLGGVLEHAAADPGNAHGHAPYDVVHSHYWLSGWVGEHAKRIWGVPHVATFHTLGEVKNAVLPPGDDPEPPVRLAGERRVVRSADRIVAPTPVEADELVELYGAERDRIRVIPPGVDLRLFAPRPKAEARARLHLAASRMLLFVGRLQPFKGPDVALRALAVAAEIDPEAMVDVVLVVVGGSRHDDGAHDEVARLMRLASSLGVADRVVFFPPQPHGRLADFFSAADVVLVPSRSESFGLVALEAQACGAPVVAAAAGGLKYSVADGESGLLVQGHEPGRYAEAVLRILRDPGFAARLSAGALAQAARFTWDATATEIRDVYREVSRRRTA